MTDNTLAEIAGIDPTDPETIVALRDAHIRAFATGTVSRPGAAPGTRVRRIDLEDVRAKAEAAWVQRHAGFVDLETVDAFNDAATPEAVLALLYLLRAASGEQLTVDGAHWNTHTTVEAERDVWKAEATRLRAQVAEYRSSGALLHTTEADRV